MLLFLGDLHLGRGGRDASRRAEMDAVELLDAHAAALRDADGGLVLLGDVFNAYMEYESLVPAGYVRLLGALARLADSGVRVHYIVGNRDHWHVEHFAREIGAEVGSGPLYLNAYGRRIFVTHGDEFARSERAYQILRPIMRSRAAYWLYRHVLPGDCGFRLASWLAGHGNGEVATAIVDDLRAAAANLLASTESDLVVMGHCHRSELTSHPGGSYLNTGYWFADRTYGVLDAHGPALRTWSSAG